LPSLIGKPFKIDEAVVEHAAARDLILQIRRWIKSELDAEVG